MIIIEPIASSSAGNCYRITDGHTALLLEAGIRMRDIQVALQFKLSELAGCLVTHEHGDHSKAVKDLIKAGVDVYASQGTLTAVKATGHRAIPIQALKQFKVGTWDILPFDVKHDASEPLGFLLANQKGEKLVFITDSAYSRYTFTGLTHIMLEINFIESLVNQTIEDEPDIERREFLIMRRSRLRKSHFSLENAVEFFRANDLSKVQEIHILHLSDGNSDEQLIKDTLEKVTGRPIYIARK
jgi:phosphoribosyl 1,2-cyclic phosphodiesterase